MGNASKPCLWHEEITMRPLKLSFATLLVLLATWAIPAAAQDDSPPAEIKLTEETLKAVIAATKEMQALDPGTEGEGQESTQSTELDAQIDAIAKKHGFADGPAYDQAFESAVQAFTVIDWASESRKKGAADEIAAIKADSELSEEAKKEAIALVEQDLAAPPPSAMPENVELAKGHEAELRELLSSDIGP
jgi:hypothetical protein